MNKLRNWHPIRRCSSDEPGV